MTGELIRLSTKDIVVGTPLAWPIYDSNGTFLVKQGFVIKSASQLERLIARGAFVAKSKLEQDEASADENKNQKIKDVSPFTLLEDVTSQLAISLATTEDADANFSREILELVDIIQKACQRDPNAALASLFVLEANSYPIKHSVDVAVISEVVAKSSGVPVKQRQSMIAAALTMNIAMIELQEKLYRQQSPLTVKQQTLIEEHPKQAVLILRKAGVEDILWLKCVLAHHETITGTGYPRKLKGGQYPKLSQFISIADQYCARLSPRAYRDPLLHKSILRDILLDKGQTVELDVAALFIKELGFYPPGLIVKLANAEIGVVTKRGDRPDCPVVHVCTRPGSDNYASPKQRNTAMDSYKIRSILLSDDPDVSFDRRAVWQYHE